MSDGSFTQIAGREFLNMSITGDAEPAQVVERLREPLLNLGQRLQDSMSHL